MKYTQANLDKLGDILGESDYVVRYERGTFQSGWCLLEQKKVVVLNKFLNVEGRINTLLELIPQINIDFDRLTHGSQKLYEEVLKRASAAQAEDQATQQELSAGNTNEDAVAAEDGNEKEAEASDDKEAEGGTVEDENDNKESEEDHKEPDTE